MQELDPFTQQSGRLRLDTLIRLRWLAIIGQSATVILVDFWLGFPMPVSFCFALIACSAWLNLLLALRFPSSHRLEPKAALSILSFDAIQLIGLLAVTGGIKNPFSPLLAIPVIISATSLPLRMTVMIGSLVVTAATALAFFHLPLPWVDGSQLFVPPVYVAGMWVAVVSMIIFTAVYAYRVAQEARLLANALAATELVLQREQHLSALDGLAAAAAHELGTPLATIAIVVKEMERAMGSDPRIQEDLALLRSQSQRCRDILKRLTSLSSEGEDHLAHMPLTSLVEEVTAPHRDFGIDIRCEPGEQIGPEPIGRRNPGVMYGLGNLIENAVDFAESTVTICWRWDDQTVAITVLDDGNGFPPEVIDRIGEPYMSTRRGNETSGGLGLGLFIAKTLLERSGASIYFRNSFIQGQGAMVEVNWPRTIFEVQNETNVKDIDLQQNFDTFAQLNYSDVKSQLSPEAPDVLPGADRRSSFLFLHRIIQKPQFYFWARYSSLRKRP